MIHSKYNILDSKRSDECIDFAMMYVCILIVYKHDK